MGIDKFYINKLTMTKLNNEEKEVLFYSTNEINDKLFDDIKVLLDSGKLCRIEMENSKSDLSMCVFCEKGIFHVGIVDMYNDVNYYYNNGSEKTKLIDIDGEVFQERMIGTDNDLLWHIIQEFAYKGKLSKKVKWIEE